MVIRCVDVGDRDPGLDPVPGHGGQRGDEAGAGGPPSGEAGALRPGDLQHDVLLLGQGPRGETQLHFPRQGGTTLELQKNLHEDFTNAEKASTRAFSWLKAHWRH